MTTIYLKLEMFSSPHSFISSDCKQLSAFSTSYLCNFIHSFLFLVLHVRKLPYVCFSLFSIKGKNLGFPVLFLST